MGRQFASGFNTSVEGLMSSNTSTHIQSLLIQVANSKTRKLLQEVTVSLNQGLTGTVDDLTRYAKLVICTGMLPEVTDESINPFAVSAPIAGISRTIKSVIVRDTIQLRFNPALIVIEGETLNVLLGLPWTEGDGMITPSACYANLSIIGRELMPDGSDNFQFKMR